MPSTLISKGNTPPTIIEVSSERVVVTVFSHLYKTDPSVVTPYGDPELTATPAARDMSVATPAKLQQRSKAPDAPQAQQQEGRQRERSSGHLASSSQQFRDPLHNGAQFPWLKNFKRFMPVMTRTELWVKPEAALSHETVTITGGGAGGEEKTSMPSPYSGPKLTSTGAGGEEETSMPSPYYGPKLTSTAEGFSMSPRNENYVSVEEEEKTVMSTADSEPSLRKLSSVSQRPYDSDKSTAAETRFRPSPATPAHSDDASKDFHSSVPSPSHSASSNSADHRKCSHAHISDDPTSSSSPGTAATNSNSSFSHHHLPPGHHHHRHAVANGPDTRTRTSRKHLDDLIETRTALMFSTVKNFQTQTPKFHSVNASGAHLHSTESAVKGTSRFLPFQKKNKTVDLT